MNKIDIINRIGYIRVRAKLTQKALSYAIEMNPSYINRLESQKDFLPSLEVLLKIIEACGSTPEEFFYGNIESYEADRQVLEQIKALPIDVKDFFSNYDPDVMSLFCKINRKGVPLSTHDLTILKKTPKQ